MSRNARVVVPEVPHHVTQRGIRKSDIFIEEEDYRKYTDLIIENSRKYGVVIRSYSWMLVDPTWDPRDVIPDWAGWLAIPNEACYDKMIRDNTRTGFPCGDECFVSGMEEQLGRILRVQRRGPKRRMPKNSGIQLELC